jgi:hypothetical protein
LEEINLKKYIQDFIFSEDGSRLIPKRTSRDFLEKYHSNFLTKLESETSFLGPEVSVSQRMWTILLDISEVPRCPCGNLVNYSKPLKKYREFCSPYCEASKDEYVKRIKKTSFERYGVSIPMKSPKIREKLSRTLQSRTEAEIKKSNQKAKETCLKRYGVSNPMQSKGLKEKFVNNYKEKTGFSNPSQNPAVREKIKTNSIERYGVPNYTQKNFSPLLKSLLLEDDTLKSYLKKEHYSKKKSLSEIGENLGVGPHVISYYFQKFELQALTTYSSKEEMEIRDFIRQLYEGEVLTNNRTLIYPLELDLLMPGKHIAIEYHGLFWHSYDRRETVKEKFYHHKKYSLCSEKGFRLFSIFGNEWLDPDKRCIWESILKRAFGIDVERKVYARNCTVKEVTVAESRYFYSKNHLQGFAAASTHLGLYHKDELLSMMSFRRNKQNYELVRFCSLTSVRVVGGGSKLLSNFYKTHSFKSLVTFADLRYTTGNVYEKLGFKLDGEVPPRYWYTDSKQLFHRRRFQKKNLQHILGEEYDPTKSEIDQIFEKTSLRRIWDCGKLRFVYRKG